MASGACVISGILRTPPLSTPSDGNLVRHLGRTPLAKPRGRSVSMRHVSDATFCVVRYCAGRTPYSEAASPFKRGLGELAMFPRHLRLRGEIPLFVHNGGQVSVGAATYGPSWRGHMIMRRLNRGCTVFAPVKRARFWPFLKMASIYLPINGPLVPSYGSVFSPIWSYLVDGY